MVTGKLCADFQDVAFDHLEDRLRRALDFVDYQRVPVTSLVVVGGVAANGELRRYCPWLRTCSLTGVSCGT